jgi:bleomycin hydrolase
MKPTQCILLLLVFCHFLTFSQTVKNKKDGGYEFTFIKKIESTPVKNQFKSSTCWSFSTASFFESEIMRAGKPAVDLSEMFFVRHTYAQKADKYLRMMGAVNFGPGGAFHDVLQIMKSKGAMPNDVYTGGLNPYLKPQHGEIDQVLKAMLDAAIKLPDGKLNPNTRLAIDHTLDAYFGALPEKFKYEGKEYTPKEFNASLGLDPDQYVELSSFTHHPFYESFILEVPDNWAWKSVYNVPLNDLESIVQNAITNNYTIAWGADVSEFGFSMKNGIAVVHQKPKEEMSQAEKDSAFSSPFNELTINEEIRQKAFDDLSTQDDHGMQITGMAKDQNGKTYYYVKNSWGTDANELGGYFFCSSSYFRYKTTSILVNKKAIPESIAKKLKL